MVRKSAPVPPIATETPAIATSVPTSVSEPIKRTKKAKSVESVATTTPVVESSIPEVPLVDVPVVDEKPVIEPVVETAAAVTPLFASVRLLDEFATKLQALSSNLSALKNDFKALEKGISKDLKSAQKKSNRKKNNANRKPSGFITPVPISDELAAFLGKPAGSTMSRIEVSTEIHKYIKTNNLKNKENGREIIPDAKLSTLLKIQPDEKNLTYFNLQKFLKVLFVKPESAPVVV